MAQFVWREALTERGKVNKRKRKCTCGWRERIVGGERVVSALDQVVS